MPTIRVVDDNVIEFVDSNGDVAAREEYDEAASEVSFVDGDGNPMPVSLGDATAESVNTAKASIENIGASAKLSSDQTVSSGVKTKVQFDSAIFESLDVVEHDAANNQFIAQEDGVYNVQVLISFSGLSSGDKFVVLISVNGADVAEFFRVSNGAFRDGVCISRKVDVASGATFAAEVRQTSGASQDLDSLARRCNMQVIRDA